MGYLIATQSLIEKIKKEVEKEPEFLKKILLISLMALKYRQKRNQ